MQDEYRGTARLISLLTEVGKLTLCEDNNEECIMMFFLCRMGVRAENKWERKFCRSQIVRCPTEEDVLIVSLQKVIHRT